MCKFWSQSNKRNCLGKTKKFRVCKIGFFDKIIYKGLVPDHNVQLVWGSPKKAWFLQIVQFMWTSYFDCQSNLSNEFVDEFDLALNLWNVIEQSSLLTSILMVIVDCQVQNSRSNNSEKNPINRTQDYNEIETDINQSMF